MSISFSDGPGGSKPSVADLASFAKRAGEIPMGGGDDIVELGDDLGIGLLANTSKISVGAASPGRQVSFGGGGGGTPRAEAPQIQINPVSDLDVVDLDAAPGVSDIRIQRDADPAPFTINTGFGGGGGGGSSGGGGGGIDLVTGESLGSGGGSRMSAEEESREKQRLLTKLRRLDNDGVTGRAMTMSNTLEEIKTEHDARTDSKSLEASIRFQRNALMTFVSGVEMVTENKRVRDKLPVKPRLKGWSESVHTNIGDFDDIFEELYDLYKDKAKVHPLLRLVGTLGVSATMYHLTNNAAEQSGIPGMADLMNDDPELQRIIAQKMAARMGGIGQFMSAAGGFGGPGPAPSGMGGSGMGGPAPMGAAPRPPTPPNAMPAGSGRMPFNMAAAMAEDVAAAGGPRVRREMRGPSGAGVDDILRAFETERLMQAATAATAPPTDSVFTPDGPPPPSARGVSVLRAGVGSSSDPLGDLMADDSGSVISGGTGTTERRRGRPRRPVAAPVGATLDLNV
jgi:hypothetical protein